MKETDGSVQLTNLEYDTIKGNQLLQYTVPPNVWFGAFPANDFNIASNDVIEKHPPIDVEKHFSDVGCTCAPAFEFADFELPKHSDLISRFSAHKSLSAEFEDGGADLNPQKLMEKAIASEEYGEVVVKESLLLYFDLLSIHTFAFKRI
ncbi:hypothetical protein AgCh_035645 [Apium graveolens]